MEGYGQSNDQTGSSSDNSENKSSNQQQISQYYLNQQMKAVGLSSKSNSVSPIRLASNNVNNSGIKGKTGKSPIG